MINTKMVAVKIEVYCFEKNKCYMLKSKSDNCVIYLRYKDSTHKVDRLSIGDKKRVYMWQNRIADGDNYACAIWGCSEISHEEFEKQWAKEAL